MGDLKGSFAPRYEAIIFATKGRYELPGKRPDDLIACAKVGNQSLTHPNEKPVALLEQLIEATTIPGALILDPFAGSGSTLAAAAKTGRQYIGIEIDEQYSKLAAARADEQIAAINEKVAAARKRMENGTSYLTSCLADFFATVPHKETKTTEKYRLLSGTLTFKKGTTKTKLDETKLVPWLKANGYGELVKVEESTRWADLKKLLSYTGDIATLTETGEIVEGVTVYETPGIFTVDV